jgi:hypothetical protein
MILFLSSAFLRRLRIQWKPALKGFLIGDRNLFFFYPDLFLESNEITPATIDSLLKTHGKENTQLLGFLTPDEMPFLPGYVELITHNEQDPGKWDARVHLLGDQGNEYRTLELKIGTSNGNS